MSQELRKHIVHVLRVGGAHLSFDDIITGFPAELRGKKPAGAPHSAWQLLEHLRLAQWDILEFSINPKHVSPDFPSGYWPKEAAPPNDAAWDASIASFKKDLARFEKLVEDPATDLLKKVPHGKEETVLSQALLAADHNAYHLGQLLLLRRLIGAWKELP